MNDLTDTIDCYVCGDSVRYERCPHTDCLERELDSEAK